MSAAPPITGPKPATDSFDLDGYFRRIGYDGPREATLDVLRAIHDLHPQAIPFENLDPFMGINVDLDPAAVHDKLVGSRRGGYCFEHNLILKRALSTLGFTVTALAARVLWGQPEDAITPRSHQLLHVEIDGQSWLADTGFGGQTLTAPILVESGLEQETPHERFRIIETGDYHRLQSHVEGEWRTLYRFDFAPQFDVDFKVSSHFLCTNPASHFVTTLALARTAPGKRFTVRGNSFAIHETGGRTERREIASADELVEIVESVFGIDIADRAAFQEMLRTKNTVLGS